ncbi:hypothetical protein BDFB_015050 [Asbolus verrucosus]|uniref:Uncharacterized protein n=1 Tax=Asbolus verrucosus TaxID=1661398 RepID=A0A482VNL1_ASBVE|nr:hypothetical protein BDFB_015050 [Asbolus verrucosus]
MNIQLSPIKYKLKMVTF